MWEQALDEAMEELGDLGKVAQMSRAKQKTMFKPKKLTAKKVFMDFSKIAQISGSKSPLFHAKMSQYLFVLVTLYPFDGVLDRNAT